MDMTNFKKVSKTVFVTGLKTVSFGAGWLVIKTVAKGGVETLKDIKLDDLLK